MFGSSDDDEEEDEEGDKEVREITGAAAEEEEEVRGTARKTLRLSSDQLKSLGLEAGRNEVTFSVTTAYQGTKRCSAHIYLWSHDDRLIISDIDGTITRSDVLGQILPLVGKDWSQTGICRLFQAVTGNGYKFLYLSARAIGQSSVTKGYLESVKQNNFSLPEGPLLLAPSSLITAFHKEVIEKCPEEFKIGCLRDVQALFPPARNPFYAGFGNKINDMYAYRAVNIPISRVFLINSAGELSIPSDLTREYKSTYGRLHDIADMCFPPLHGQSCVSLQSPLVAPHDFSSFTYWRAPMPDVTLEIEEFMKPPANKKAASPKK